MERRCNLAVPAALALALITGACARGDSPQAGEGDPIFGTQDTACASVSTRNEDGDEALLAQVSTCLREQVQARRPVTVDVAVLTAEGDPIYHRYAYDGDRILIVEDNRADEFGRGRVAAQSCTGLHVSDWLPQGIDCRSAEHPGFPEASS